MQPKTDDQEFSLLPKFHTEQVSERLKTSFGFRIHFYAAIVIVLFMTFLWTILQSIPSVPRPVFPFWLFFGALFAISLSGHFYLGLCEQKEWLSFHFSVFVSWNIFMFLTWSLRPKGDSTSIWFIIPPFILLNFLVVHYCWEVFRKERHRLIWTHVCLFWSINLQNFLINIAFQRQTSFPWFPIVFFAMGFLLVAHWTYHWEPDHWFLLHLRIYFCACLLIFVIWAPLRANSWRDDSLSNVCQYVSTGSFVSNETLPNLSHCSYSYLCSENTKFTIKEWKDWCLLSKPCERECKLVKSSTFIWPLLIMMVWGFGLGIHYRNHVEPASVNEAAIPYPEGENEANARGTELWVLPESEKPAFPDRPSFSVKDESRLSSDEELHEEIDLENDKKPLNHEK